MLRQDPTENWTPVTAINFPLVHWAFDRISGGTHPTYNVPYEYSRELTRAEEGLKQVPKKIRLKLCRGDYEVKQSSAETVIAYEILTAFTFGWPAFGKPPRRR